MKRKLSVFLGGNESDSKASILNLLDICESIDEIRSIHIVVSENYSDEIINYNSIKTTVHRECELLYEVINDSQWGISSSGVSKYEFAALNIPTLLFALVNHQIELAQEAEKYVQIMLYL